jgi:hypothetical protein
MTPVNSSGAGTKSTTQGFRRASAKTPTKALLLPLPEIDTVSAHDIAMQACLLQLELTPHPSDPDRHKAMAASDIRPRQSR